MKWTGRLLILAVLVVMVRPSVEYSAADEAFSIEIVPAVFSADGDTRADYVGFVVSYHSPQPVDLHLYFSLPLIVGKNIDGLLTFEDDELPSDIVRKDLRGVSRKVGINNFVSDISATYGVARIGTWRVWIIFLRQQIVNLSDIQQVPVHALIMRPTKADEKNFFIHITRSRTIAIGEILAASPWKSERNGQMLERIAKWKKPKPEKGI